MKTCPKCNAQHEKSGTFCSRSCANSRQFSEDTRKLKAQSSAKYWEGRIKTVSCKGCGIAIPKKNYRLYCDECRQNKVTLPDTSISAPSKITPIEYTQQLIDSGDIHKLQESVIRKHMKRFLINRDGHRCCICGTETWCGLPVPLVCDHIDGNSSNSSLDNFRVVCCNCDAQLDTYKSKNRGRGRKYDREYYNRSKEA